MPDEYQPTVERHLLLRDLVDATVVAEKAGISLTKAEFEDRNAQKLLGKARLALADYDDAEFTRLCAATRERANATGAATYATAEQKAEDSSSQQGETIATLVSDARDDDRVRLFASKMTEHALRTAVISLVRDLKRERRRLKVF